MLKNNESKILAMLENNGSEILPMLKNRELKCSKYLSIGLTV